MRVLTITRNAVHGGVETMIRYHQHYLGSAVVVVGGHEKKDTCPFNYTYLGPSKNDKVIERLELICSRFDIIIYHWLPEWVVEVIGRANRPTVEVVHRDDTSDCNKAVPTIVITHSHFLASFLEKEYARPAFVVPHGLPVPAYHQQGNPRQRKVIGGVTSYRHYKGIDQVVDVFQNFSLPKQKFTGLFYGSGNLYNKFKASAESICNRNLTIRGPVKGFASVQNQFDVVLHPSRHEGMPYAVLEALSFGLPTISSDVDGIRELSNIAKQLGRDLPIFIFERGNITALKRSIDRSIYLLDRENDRIKNSAKWICQYYDLELHLKRFSILLEYAQMIHTARYSPKVGLRSIHLTHFA